MPKTAIHKAFACTFGGKNTCFVNLDSLIIGFDGKFSNKFFNIVSRDIFFIWFSLVKIECLIMTGIIILSVLFLG